MSAAHEVLVHAGARTSFEADRGYIRQIRACIDLNVAITHVLQEDSNVCTPERQHLTKITTPSTTRSDRSDLVLDSQIIRTRPGSNFGTDENLFTRSIHGDPTRSSDIHPNHQAATYHNTQDSISLQNVYEASLRRFTEHERLFHIQEHPINTRPLQGSRLSTVKDGEPTCHRDINHPVANWSRPSVTPLQLDSTTGATKAILPDALAVRPIASSTPMDALGFPKNGTPKEDFHSFDISNMTAREALAYRERQAQLRRISNHRGLRAFNPLPVSSDQHGFDTSTKTSCTRQPLAIPVESITSTPNLCPRPSIAPKASTDSPDPTAPTCVNRYITVTTEETHGETRTPTSDEHTSLPSDRSDRKSVEMDMSSRMSISPGIAKRRAGEEAPDLPKKIRVLTRGVLSESFVVAQYNSPFYNSSFRDMSRDSFVPAGTGEIQWTASGDHCSMSNCAITTSTTSVKNVMYSDQSLAQILGTARSSLAVTNACPPTNGNTSNQSQAEPQERTTSRALYRVTAVDVAPCISTDTSRGNQKKVLFRLPLPIDRSLQDANASVLNSIGSGVEKVTIEKTEKLQSPQLCGYKECVPKPYAACQPFMVPLVEIDKAQVLMPEFLQEMRVPHKLKRRTRDLRPEERGYWEIDLARLNFSIPDGRKLWNDMSRVITTRQLYWVTLQFCSDKFRLYCYGQCVMQVWTLIYASTRLVKQGIPWVDAGGSVVLFH